MRNLAKMANDSQFYSVLDGAMMGIRFMRAYDENDMEYGNMEDSYGNKSTVKRIKGGYQVIVNGVEVYDVKTQKAAFEVLDKVFIETELGKRPSLVTEEEEARREAKRTAFEAKRKEQFAAAKARKAAKEEMEQEAAEEAASEEIEEVEMVDTDALQELCTELINKADVMIEDARELRREILNTLIRIGNEDEAKRAHERLAIMDLEDEREREQQEVQQQLVDDLEKQYENNDGYHLMMAIGVDTIEDEMEFDAMIDAFKTLNELCVDYNIKPDSKAYELLRRHVIYQVLLTDEESYRKFAGELYDRLTAGAQ